MATQKFTQGTIIRQREDSLKELLLIMDGSVRACYEGGEIHLGKGDVIGLCDLAYAYHSCTYIASDNTTVLLCKLNIKDNDVTLPSSGIEFDMLLLNSMIRQACAFMDSYLLLQFNSDNMYEYLKECYEEYVALCSKYILSPKALPGFELIQPISVDEDLAPWISSYYESLARLSSDQKKVLASSPALLKGNLLKASMDMHAVFSLAHLYYDYEASTSSVLLNEEQLDFLDLYTGILIQAAKNNADTTALATTISTMMIHIEGISSISPVLYNQRVMQYRQTLDKLQNPPAASAATTVTDDLKGSLDKILRYSEIEPEEAANFKACILSYKLLGDRNAQTDEAMKIRSEITKEFYEIYNSAFQISLMNKDIPLAVKLFLNFGYVDEELAGVENTAYLASIVDDLKGDPESGVYTAYEWFKAIYYGEKEPSRNAFETDYAGNTCANCVLQDTSRRKSKRKCYMTMHRK